MFVAGPSPGGSCSLGLPNGGYRILQEALLASLGGNYALGEELKNLDALTADVTETDVRAVLA